ncbi:hypothetical protein HanRHA438_Chr09g0427961 [Helianthus annuus]|nr:hypothetical protein HanRHA438_Chr09g0427961 [Helianthus annuus]
MIHHRSLHLHQCTFPVGGITFNLGCAQRLPPSVFLIPCSPDIFLLIYLRHSLPPLSPRSTRYEPSSPESSPTIRSLKESKMSRVGDLSSASGSGSANHYSSSHMVSRDNKDDSGRFSGLLSSSGSPRIGLSRSSSRLSLPDGLDDIDFSSRICILL